MNPAAYILFATDWSWYVAAALQQTADESAAQHEVSVDVETPPEEIARRLRGALQALNYTGQPVTLAIPSTWCLAATIDANPGTSARSESAESLLYRLEEQFPVPAEELAADFIASAEGGYLGVALLTSKVADLIAAMESEGIALELICPTALLALAQFQGERSSGHDSGALRANVVAWQVDGQALRDWLCLSDTGGLLSWRLLPMAEPSLAQELRHRHLQTDGPIRLAMIGETDPPVEARTSIQDVDVECVASAQRSAARRACAAISRGSLQPPLNLLRGRLAIKEPLRPIRAPLDCAFGAAAVLLLTLAVGLLWRTDRYDRQAIASEARQSQAFAGALPGKPLPPDPLLLLESESHRLAALSGASTSLPHQVSALECLRDLLAALPKDLRFRLLDISFDGRRVLLDGQARAHKDAEMVASALRLSGKFDVDAPHSEQLADAGGAAVSLSIGANVKDSGPTPQGAGGP